MKLKCSNKSLITIREPNTYENSAVLDDSLVTIYKDVVDDLCYPSSIAISNPAAQLWSLLPRTCNSQPFEPC